MVKKLNVTVRDRVMELINTNKPEGTNNSEWVEDLIVIGLKQKFKKKAESTRGVHNALFVVSESLSHVFDVNLGVVRYAQTC